MWYFLQPTARTLSLLSNVASTLTKGNCRGGAVLTVLHDAALATTGEPAAYQLCRRLAEEVRLLELKAAAGFI